MATIGEILASKAIQTRGARDAMSPELEALADARHAAYVQAQADGFNTEATTTA